ncbi:NADH-quinone oxidoreductase subunit A [Gleimia hominis]|uniref:NADH-quinone oxidoreductase subunit A n=1 Tax=Gleimia hominis TaxID=595468 RepID=A0ABU3I9P8_9ACTO|nr:NADH-quinone oxidoreductase subunit A [Gleimia hominis]MDT3767094.1 NADH-quinone oxidoreductase subunit A [Gleimia hominis]WIK64537.1 NADH-quinone oxidoreductase subunit A [Gleimia hominis]
MTNPYIPLLIMAAAAVAVALGGLGASAILGPTVKNKIKTANYECGVEPTEAEADHGRFPVKYYLVAMTFIVFDIEVVFLYPWAVSFGKLGLFGLVVMMTFLLLILVPYVYEWRRGGLDWT